MSNCKVIALTNQKSGVGKITTAVNLGVSLAQQGKKVLLINADVQTNLTMSLGYNRPDDLPVTLSTTSFDSNVKMSKFGNKPTHEYLTAHTAREIHKLLCNDFNQGVK